MARRLLPQRPLTVFPQPAGASGTATASRKSCSFWDPQALDDTGTSGQSLSPRQAVAGQPTKTSHSWMTAFLQNQCVTFFFFFSVLLFPWSWLFRRRGLDVTLAIHFSVSAAKVHRWCNRAWGYEPRYLLLYFKIPSSVCFPEVVNWSEERESGGGRR